MLGIQFVERLALKAFGLRESGAGAGLAQPSEAAVQGPAVVG
jgi:hypothetical protein